MEELFSNLNLEEAIEVDTTTPILESSQAQEPKPGEKQMAQQPAAEIKDLLEVDAGTESSLNVEKKPEVKVVEDTLKKDVKSIMEGEDAGTTKSKEDKQAPKAESAEDKNSPSSSPFLVFAKVLHEEGVLSSLDETKFKGDTIEELTSAIAEEIHLNVESYKESLPEAIKEIIANYEEGVPLDQLIAAKSKQMEYDNIKDEDMKDIALQKEVLMQDFLLRGYEEKDAKDLVQDAEDLGKLEAKSKTALTKLKAAYKGQQEAMKAQVDAYKKQLAEQQKAQLIDIKKQIDETKEIIPGIELNKGVRDKIYQSMTTIIETDDNNRPLNAVMSLRAKDPMAFEKKLHYYVALGLFNEKPDMTKIMATAKTTAAKEFEAIANKNLGLKGGTPVKQEKEGVKTDLRTALAGFQPQ